MLTAMPPRVSRRLLLALVFAAAGLVNLVANACWLRTGDIHRPNLHVAMRGGWPGFWFTTVLFGMMLIAGVVMLALEWRARLQASSRSSNE